MKNTPHSSLIESLEPRQLLFTSGLIADPPALSDLADPRNTVVRLDMAQGAVDIELFDVAGPTPSAAPAPRAAQNFLDYVNAGRYDQTFFHRLASNFVLQGGGFGLKDPVPTAAPRAFSVTTNPPIVNEFSATRSNIERTVAFAKLGSSPDSATSQFFFNLADNSQNLNNQNGGFTVFGRVVKGWSVVTTIAALTPRNLQTFLQGTPGDLYSAVPTTGTGNTDLVFIRDAEVIKLREVRGFTTESIVFPDGFRTRRITSDVNIVNPDANNDAGIQVIARYEGSLRRDVVVWQGIVAAGSSRNVRVSDGDNTALARVRAGVGFSLEVRSTQRVSAQWVHRDFGAVANEAFFNPSGFTADDLRTWSIAGMEKSTGVRSFLTVTNLTGTPANLLLNVTTEAGTTQVLTLPVGSWRRGGVDFNQISGLPSGTFSLGITSDQPIVAAASVYRETPSRASAELGTPGLINQVGTTGVIPAARVATGGVGQLSFDYNAAAAGAPTSVTIDITFVLASGNVVQASSPVVLSSGLPRRDVDILSLSGQLVRDQFFSIRYQVRNSTAPVSGSYISTSPEEVARTGFITRVTPTQFISGFLTIPGGSGTETISLYNPYTTAASATAQYRLKFHFFNSNQDEIIIPALGQGTLAAGARVDIRIADLPEIIARVNQGTQFRRYAVSIESVITQAGNRAGGLVAQYTRIGGTDTSTTGTGLDSTTVIPLNDPRFNSLPS